MTPSLTEVNGLFLKEKGSDVWSVDLQTGLRDVLKFMDEKNIGAVLVKDENKIAGIFSERDLLKSSASKGQLSEDMPIREIMTKRVLFVSPSESIEECMFLMTAKRIRHLPVIDNEKLVGLVSIGDIVNKFHSNVEVYRCGKRERESR